VWVALDSAAWYYGQEVYAVSGSQSVIALVQRYYLAEALAIFIALAGAYLTFRGLKSWRNLQDPNSVRFMLADALSSKRDFRLGAAAAIAYAVVYLFVSSIIVFQPGANSDAWAGLAPLSWNVAACCGSVGTVPALVFYVAPQAHVAMQVLPLDVLFAAVVPLLVGFNVTVAVHAVRNKDVRANVGWVSTVGILAGLFTGCPTCAGLFLASAFGGIGATSLAVALAPYQMLFVVVSIPLLAVSPLLIAFNARRAQLAACPVPTPSVGRA
jgi:heme/copper-type cytochrome/quinol oxidase subunit 3